MTYRALRPGEIVALARQWQALREWEGIRAFVHALYGPTATLATLEILSMYNDFRYDDRALIHAFAADGTHLWYDFAQPWWAEHGLTDAQIEGYSEEVAEYRQKIQIETRAGYREEMQAFGPLALNYFDLDEVTGLQRRFTRYIGIRLLERPQPRDAVSITYDLLVPPPLTYARVFVPRPA